MKIKYEFVDGTVSEVEVEESIGAIIVEDRRLEENLARKECYHCYSLDAAQFEGSEYGTEETPEVQMERKQDTERIASALDGQGNSIYFSTNMSKVSLFYVSILYKYHNK